MEIFYVMFVAVALWFLYFLLSLVSRTHAQVPVILPVIAANHQTIHAATTATKPAIWPATVPMAIANVNATVTSVAVCHATTATRAVTSRATAQMARNHATAVASWATSAVSATKTAAATKVTQIQRYREINRIPLMMATHSCFGAYHWTSAPKPFGEHHHRTHLSMSTWFFFLSGVIFGAYTHTNTHIHTNAGA